jgi:hypothetical protein
MADLGRFRVWPQPAAPQPPYPRRVATKGERRSTTRSWDYPSPPLLARRSWRAWLSQDACATMAVERAVAKPEAVEVLGFL